MNSYTSSWNDSDMGKTLSMPVLWTIIYVSTLSEQQKLNKLFDNSMSMLKLIDNK